jgi:Ser/Thr protein kinase RdoA (MazF antagonist)
MWGYPLQDIAITFYYLQDREDYNELKSAFRSGYQTCLSWPEQYDGQLDILIAGRGLDLLNYVIQDKDPEWRRHSTAFIARNEQRLKQLGIA